MKVWLYPRIMHIIFNTWNYFQKNQFFTRFPYWFLSEGDKNGRVSIQLEMSGKHDCLHFRNDTKDQLTCNSAEIFNEAVNTSIHCRYIGWKGFRTCNYVEGNDIGKMCGFPLMLITNILEVEKTNIFPQWMMDDL